MPNEAPGPLRNPARLARLEASGLLDSPPEAAFDRLARLATRFLRVPVALVSLVDADRQFFKSCVGLPEPWASRRETPLSHSFCQHVVATGEPLVIDDARTDPRVAGNLAIPEIGVGAYLGIPIAVDGQVLGSFCAINTGARAWTPDDVDAMVDLAQSVVSEVRLRAEAAERDRLRLEAEAARKNIEVTLASIGDAVIAADAAGDVTFLNPAACTLTGWDPGDAVGQPVEAVFDIVEEGSGRRLDRFVENVLATGIPAAWRDHTILIARDGCRREIEESAAPIVLEGQVIGAVVTFRNVGPRKRQAKALQDAKLRLDYALSAGSVATWTWDIPGDRIIADENLARFFGVTPEEAAGGKLSAYFKAIHPDDHDRVGRAIESSLAGGGSYDAEYRVMRPDGGVRWVNARGHVERDAAGKVVALNGVVIDTSDRHRAEEAIRQSEGQLRAFVAASSDVVYRMSADWSVLHRLVGREFIADTDEASRDWLEGYVDGADQPGVVAALREAIRSKGTFELEHRVRQVDGSLGWVHSRAVPLLDDRGEVTEWFGTATDITERKRAEEDLRSSEERYRTLFTSIDEGYCVIQVLRDDTGRAVDYRFLELNPAFERQTGFKDAAGKRMREIIPDHDEFWFETYGRVAATGQPLRFQHSSESMNGQTFDLYALPIGESAEQKVAVLFTNITHRVRNRAERENLVEQLTDADRRKDEFLAMLAHELRNPLGAISTAIRLVEDEQRPELLAEVRDTIRHQVGHLTHLIDDLLDVSRITQGKIELRKRTVELAAVVRKAAELARPQVEEKRHELTVSTPDEPVAFVADPTRVEQMLSNLLTNSAKYSEPGRAIDLSATEESGEVVFRVRDQGFGISAEMLPKVFGLFTQVDATLDRARGGLGIGLTLVKTLAEMHGGSIAAASEGEGRGSEFTLRLPIGEPDPLGMATSASDAPKLPAPSKPPGMRRILIIDDNRDTARMTSRLLSRQGCAMMAAYDGFEGIEAAKAFGPDVILLDIGLPGLNGYEVAAAVRDHECCRDSVIVAVSGYGETAARERSKGVGIDHHLTKPLDFDELDAILREPRSRAAADR